MRSEHRENTPVALPIVIPFPSLPSVELPEPFRRFHAYFAVNGLPIHFVGERWKKSDAPSCPIKTFPDPDNPELVVSLRLEGEVDGLVIQKLSPDEYREMVSALTAQILRAGSRAARRS